MKRSQKAAAIALLAATVAGFTVTPAAAAGPITFTYAGDSLTDTSNVWSWTKYLDSDPDLQSVGGIAKSGKTSGDIRNDPDLVARDADVLVVMLGTNDVRFGVEQRDLKLNIAAIVSKVGARHVVIAALPPSNLRDYQQNGSQPIDRALQGFVQNRSLQDYASRQGWLYVNPFSSVQQSDNTWSSGASIADGVHPTGSTASTYVGPRMAVAIRQAVEGAKS